MVSKFSYNSFKQMNLEGPVKFATFILVPLGFVLIARYPPISLLVIFGGYALSGPLLWLYRRTQRGVGAGAAGHAGIAAMDVRASYLQAMGVEDWRLRTPSPLRASDSAPPGPAPPLQLVPAANDQWDHHRRRGGSLHPLRTAPVPHAHGVRGG